MERTVNDVTYIADTPQLARLLRDSTEHGYNRSVRDENLEEFIDQLDPDGVHILSAFPLYHSGLPDDDPRQGLHYHINGVEVEVPHYRMQCWIKRRGVEASEHQPMEILDMTISLVEMLPTNKPKDEAHRKGDG